jgi:hypothetical protein
MDCFGAIVTNFFEYPRGDYCEEHGPENAALMEATGTRDTRSRVMSMRGGHKNGHTTS